MARTTISDLAATLARIEAHQQNMAARVERIDSRLDEALTDRDLVPVDTRAAALADRVTALESSQRWVVRSVAGAVFTGLAGLFTAAGGRLG